MINTKLCRLRHAPSQVNFNFDKLQVTLDQKLSDMLIVYEIVECYLARKPAKTLPPQIPQQHIPSRPAPTLPPRTAFQPSSSPPNVSSNQQFATGNTLNPNFASKRAYQPDFSTFTTQALCSLVPILFQILIIFDLNL